MTLPDRPGTLPHARSFAWGAYLLVALLALAVLGAGLALLRWGDRQRDPGMVTAVRLSARPGIDLTKFEEVWDTPDYFLEVRTELGMVRSKVFKDTKIGNGLSIPMPVPLRLQDIRELRVLDDDLTQNTLKDRVDHPARETDGEKFHFTLLGEVPPPPPTRTVGLALSIAGGAVLALTVLMFVRAQVL